MTIKKIGILTGGGDCPGLNSVIYGIMLKAYDAGIECVGILKGWKGLMENLTIPLNIAEHDDLHTIGGTILYTSRTNPFKGAESKEIIAQKLVENLDKLGIDALIAIGGDDTQELRILCANMQMQMLWDVQKQLIMTWREHITRSGFGAQYS